MKQIFENLREYPKVRQVLPENFRRFYNEHYRENRDGGSKASGLAQKLERWMHRQVALDNGKDMRILEIGAGTLNHLQYEKNYYSYDIIEPYHTLYDDSPEKEKVGEFYNDISELDVAGCYDRILSIATFEHILDLPKVVAKAALLLHPEGKLKVAIPSEGSLLWYLGWRLTTGVEFYIKHKLNYATLMENEHVNTWREISMILSLFFQQVSYKSYGINRPLSFYQYYECSFANQDTAANLLQCLQDRSNPVIAD